MEEEPVAAEPAAEEPAAPAAAEEPAVEAPPEPDAQPEEPPGDAEGIPPEQEQPQDEIAQEEEPPPAEEQDDAEAVMQVNDPGEQEPQAGVDAATQDYGARSDAAEAASISDAEAREVTFVIQPEGYRHSELIYMNAPVAQVAELLESRLGIPAYALRFTLEDGSQLQRNQTLGSVAPTVRFARSVPEHLVWFALVPRPRLVSSKWENGTLLRRDSVFSAQRNRLPHDSASLFHCCVSGWPPDHRLRGRRARRARAARALGPHGGIGRGTVP